MKQNIKPFILLFTLCFYISEAKSQHYNDSILTASFHQAGKGRNCASVSVIKSAFQTFGAEDVLKEIKKVDSTYFITFKDGSKLILSQREETVANLYNAFACELSDSFLFHKAEFLYAVMAKRKQLSAPLKYPTIIDALKNPRNGNLLLIEDTEENIQLLGLGSNFKDISRDLSSIDLMRNVIITSFYHSAYSTRGTYDQYGSLISNKMFKKKHRGFWHSSNISHAYKLIP